MHKLSEKDIAAIERAVNHGGKTEAVVRVECGKISVIQVDKKKIN